MGFICCVVVNDTFIWIDTREVDYATGIGRIGPVSLGDGDHRSLGYGAIIANTLCCSRRKQKEELMSLS
jgi:hypothetical protein